MDDTGSEYQWDRSFDVQGEVEEVERLCQLRRKKQYKHSVLDRFRGELTVLYNSGLSFAQLALWLKHRKNLQVSRSAIHRKMREWPEVNIRRGK